MFFIFFEEIHKIRFILAKRMTLKLILKSLVILIFATALISLSVYRSAIQMKLNQNKKIFQDFENKIDVLGDDNVLAKACENCAFRDLKSGVSQNLYNASNITNRRQIWISMALCFSKNTDMYRKKNYPYAQVTPLALLLWNHFFSDIRIILYLIYDKYELKERRILYEENLKQTNVEIRWVEEGDLDCVTKSQLIRMWAFQEPMIKENDIIVTVDVNLFVMSPKILDPIYENPDKKVWVFGWYDTSFIESGIGETFNQNLMSAEAKGMYESVCNYTVVLLLQI